MDRSTRIAGGIAVVYLILGCAWIVWSDGVFERWALDARHLTVAQTAKGWLFVGLSALLLFVLSLRGLRRVERVERQYREVFEAGAAAMAIIDGEGRVVLGNRALAEFVGAEEPSRLRGMAADLIWPDLVDVEASDGEPRETPLKGRAARRDGLLTATPLLDGRRVFLWSDLTEIREIRRRAEEAERLHALGRLVAGVAHDFNGVLAVIGGFAEELADARRDDPAVQEIRHAVERGTGLTRQLLSLSKTGGGVPAATDLVARLAGLRPFLDRAIGYDIRLGWSTPPTPTFAAVAPLSFDRAVVNLVLNARDAMPEGGPLDVELRSVERDGEPMVELAVRDKGVGMTPEVAARATEPFFTTRGHSGTGLGLSIVRDMVDQAGGELEIESAPGQGTTIRMRLPRVEAVEASTSDKSEATSSPGGSGGDRTVLLVEDDPALRRLLSRLLSGLGYHVDAAPSCAVARRLTDASGAGFSALLADVGLPDGNGLALARELLATGRIGGVLLMSGYPDTEIEAALAEWPRTGFLPKPFSRETLESALGSIREPFREGNPRE